MNETERRKYFSDNSYVRIKSRYTIVTMLTETEKTFVINRIE